MLSSVSLSMVLSIVFRRRASRSVRFSSMPPVIAQRLDLVEPGVVEDVPDLIQREIELLEEEDLLQAQQVLLRVQPVARRGAG